MLSPSSVLKDALFLCHTKGGGGGVTKYDNGGGGLKMPKCALCNIGRTLLILREGLVRNHQEILSRWLRLVSQTLLQVFDKFTVGCGHKHSFWPASSVFYLGYYSTAFLNHTQVFLCSPK